MKQQPTDKVVEGQTFTLPTFQPHQPKNQMDISKLTEEEFQALRKSDPFMYYSIKPVMQARRSGRTISHANVMVSLQGDVDAGAGGSASCEHVKVSRKTRISDGCDSVTALSLYLDQLEDSN